MKNPYLHHRCLLQMFLPNPPSPNSDFPIPMDAGKFSLALVTKNSPGRDLVGYQKLNEDGTITVDTTAAAYDSSIGSNNTNLLLRNGRTGGSTSWTGHSFFRPRQRRRVSNNDALAQALTDGAHPTEPLGAFDAWAIDPTRLSMGEAFAQGAFGRLYRGSYDGLDVAVKLLERPDVSDDPEKGKFMEQQFSQELYMLATLDHPNIVRFVGACRKPNVCCIVTEYAKGGSVRQFLTTKREGKGMGNRIAVKQALDVARGMAYVHGLGFIHRDLKSDNLLIAGDHDIKIADFGVARIEVKTEGMTPETGTYRWMAPEMIQHRPYDHKVDVYSFGIVLWELITGTLPFQNMTAVQAAFAVVNKGARPPIPSDCHPLLAELMTSCWDTNPDIRPSFNDVVKYLEHAQTVIGTKARFRCCVVGSKTKD